MQLSVNVLRILLYLVSKSMARASSSSSKSISSSSSKSSSDKSRASHSSFRSLVISKRSSASSRVVGLRAFLSNLLSIRLNQNSKESIVMIFVGLFVWLLDSEGARVTYGVGLEQGQSRSQKPS